MISKAKHLDAVPAIGTPSMFEPFQHYIAPGSIMRYVTIQGVWRVMYFLPADVELDDQAIIHYVPGDDHYSWFLPPTVERTVNYQDHTGMVFPDPATQDGEWLIAPLYNEFQFFEITTKTLVCVSGTVSTLTVPQGKVDDGEPTLVEVPNHMSTPPMVGMTGELAYVTKQLHQELAGATLSAAIDHPVNQQTTDSIIIGRDIANKTVTCYGARITAFTDTTIKDVSKD